MARRTNLLMRGNTKLGESIHTWSIPAVETCPGRTALCQRHCYATRGRFRTHRLADLMEQNLDASLGRELRGEDRQGDPASRPSTS